MSVDDNVFNLNSDLKQKLSNIELEGEIKRKLNNLIDAICWKALEEIQRCCSKKENFYFLKELRNCDNVDARPMFSSNGVYRLSDIFPSLIANKTSFLNLSDLCDIKQKGYGAGEVSLQCLFSNMTSSDGKTGDLSASGMEIELKYTKHKASIKANEDSSYRPSNKLWEKLIGVKKRGHKQLLEGSKETFHAYFKELVPSFYEYEEFERIRNIKSHKIKKQEYGFLNLKQYQKIDKFDVLIAMAPDEKKGDFKLVVVRDFSDKEFILKNISFSPSFHRGKGTQALGDGYSDIAVTL